MDETLAVNPDDPIQEDVVKTALRIAEKVWWSQMNVDSTTRQEEDVLKQYILLCPYVSRDSRFLQAALDGIDRCAGRPVSKTTTRAVTTTTTAVNASTQVVQKPFDDSSSVGTQKTSNVSQRSVDASRRKRRNTSFGKLLRTFLCDLPIIVLFLTCAALRWIHHVHDQYLWPLMQAANFTEERMQGEVTYFFRPCTADDMTTKNGADLFLPMNATTEQAYQHQLRHGFTVFRSVLSPDTATNLRNFVVSRNRNLSKAESIFVIENENRYSFGLGTEEPTVRAAMKEVVNNSRLRPALEKILGPNPALIEMTAITSAYGAVAQYWHDDVIPTASAINYIRSFGPSYSIFIQLQNTTKQMGATGACPGSHYCSDGDIACETDGFQLVNENGHWGIGDALLMNMNSYHLGAAHTDPNALDRVMLILTFVPRPMPRAESRQMSQGITFSLRWDMWGHTLEDLAKIDTRMRHPWAYLRAFGLYKPSNTDWGIDFISSAIMRIANEDNGFRVDELEEFLQRGGITWLPSFLQANVTEDENYHHFYVKTFFLVDDFLANLTNALVGLFVLLHVAYNYFFATEKRYIPRGVLRLIFYWVCTLLCLEAARRHVDGTGWAKDIKANRRYASTTQSETRYARPHKGWPTTYPNKHDVLFETRYGSRYLHMYNDFINGHPANRYYNELVENAAATYATSNFEFQDASAAYIHSAVASAQGRFLHQTPYGSWRWMDSISILDQTKRDLAIASSGLGSVLAQEIRFLESDLKYGILRDTSLALSHASRRLDVLREELLYKVTKPFPVSRKLTSRFVQVHPAFLRRSLFRLPILPSIAKTMPRTTKSLPPDIRLSEPFPGAWISEGSTVEGVVGDHWYSAKVSYVAAQGLYFLEYPDGDSNEVYNNRIRWPVPFEIGDRVEFGDEDEDGEYFTAKILKRNEDGTYDVRARDSAKYVSGLTPQDIRRKAVNIVEKFEYQSAY